VFPFKRWTHAHSTCTGFLGSLALIHWHIWLLLIGVFVLGWVSHWLYATMKSAVDYWLWRRKRTATATKGVKRETKRVSLQTDEIPY